MPDDANRQQLRRRFLTILAHCTGERHGSVAAALRRAGGAHVDAAFQLLAISAGLREAGILEGPAAGAWGGELGVHMRSLWGRVQFVANARAMRRADFDALVDAYLATRERVRPAVERRVGRALGYLTPQPRAADGEIDMWLALPGGQHVRTQFGPQSLHVTPRVLRQVPALQRRWSAFARRLHPQLQVAVTLRLFDAEEA